MDKDALIEELRGIIQDYLKARALDLVDLAYRYEGRDLVLMLLADWPEGGISLGECARLNSDISRILYEKGILQEGFTLEVSSPGIDRPLKTKADFSRCMNRKIRVFLKEQINGKFEIAGIISKTGDDSAYIDAQGELIEIPLTKISKAKQVVGNI